MQRNAGLPKLLPGPEEQDQRSLRCRFPQALRRRLPKRYRARNGNLSGFPLVGGGGQEGGQYRPDQGHRGAGNRNQHRCSLGQGYDRPTDPSLRARRSHRRGQRKEAQGAGRLPAAEAVGHRRGVRSYQEPERQPAIRDQDLKAWLAVGFFLGKANVALIALLAIQVLYAIASLALISVGLAIIFGMMRVINIAHGEFLMLGGYAAIVATSHDRVPPSRWNLQDARLL